MSVHVFRGVALMITVIDFQVLYKTGMAWPSELILCSQEELRSMELSTYKRSSFETD